MKSTTIIGIILILLGILFLGPVFGLFSLNTMWPAILLLLGLGFFIAYFAVPTIIGFLMPGAVLVVSSIPLLTCAITRDWTQMAFLWPIFILSVSLGFFLMYFIGKRIQGLLIPALILLAVGSISFLILNYMTFIFPILFFVAGLVLVFIGLTGRKKEQKETTPEPEETGVEE